MSKDTPVTPPKEIAVTMGGATINFGRPPFDEPPIITTLPKEQTNE